MYQRRVLSACCLSGRFGIALLQINPSVGHALQALVHVIDSEHKKLG